MADACPVCDGDPRVLVAVRHSAMRRYIRELLSREHHCWTGAHVRPGESIREALERIRPDVVVVDAADFPACCRSAVAAFPPARAIVIGPEPDPAYRRAAAEGGAGGWMARERVPDELGPALRAALGCTHDPCPQPEPAAKPSP